MSPILSNTKLALRESKDMSKLLTLDPHDRRVVVYSEDAFTWVQLSDYLDALWTEHQIPYQYISSDADDPLFGSPPPGATMWYVDRQLPRLLAKLECDLFITTMPDLGKFQVPRPKKGRTVYVFHSLNSTHSAYRNGAFDHYDVIFCTGPHHVAELERLRESNPADLRRVGYPKLDVIGRDHAAFGLDKIEPRTALIAPSWGRGNLLESSGSEAVSSLLDSGFRVVVRPHPQFFHSLYPEGKGVVDSLMDEFGSNEMVEFELSIRTQRSFHYSTTMVSDWSGAAYEYALGTLRPVLFVDTPQKVFNDDWESVGLPSFEREMRSEVGSIISKDHVRQLGEVAAKAVDDPPDTRRRLGDLAEQTVFNFRSSARVGAEVIASHLA